MIGRLAAGAAIVVGLVWALRSAGDVVADAAGVASSTGVVTVLVLAGLLVVDRAVRGLTVAASLPGATFGRGVVLQETGAACSGGIPGGGVVATGIRVAMARSWGFDPAPSLLSIAAATEAFGLGVRVLAVAVIVPEIVQGTADGTDLAIVGVLSAVTVGTIAVWVLLSRDTPLLRWWMRTVTRVHRLVGRVIRFRWFVRFEPACWIQRFSVATRVLLERPVRLFAPAILAQAVGAVSFVVALRSTGVDLDIGTLVRIHLLSRVLAGFSPTPGGIGVLEAGLTAALVASGAGEVDALAGVLLFRAFTYAVPIVLGAAVIAWWRFVGAGASSGVRPPIAPEEPSTGGPMTVRSNEVKRHEAIDRGGLRP